MGTLGIWERIKKGDRTALQQLFDQYYHPLCIYLLQYTKKMDEAEDIVQNIFLNLWERRTTLNIKRSLKSYLYSYAYNEFIEATRKDKRDTLLIDRLTYEALQPKIEQSYQQKETIMDKLSSSIDSLPPRCKEILLLSKMEGYDYKSIADKLEISVKTVEAQMQIAFKRIRKEFKRDGVIFFLIQDYTFTK
ncbi:RNA polymerase sigma factor [Flavivirga sp. 57AJ16]|uniref:RNA polymerase sigma factor n=1 Tax=Flavivirga sp. 57AJ16 TaxID=3025307 RepID=UPI00236626B9|nr:RNA polymerase sigma-70 factor [Flavivirga sp. 57AJ16]MDD7886927.1 RNA polymerase sigma-70 factor [Flavivirga sp. 57AJ16]